MASFKMLKCPNCGHSFYGLDSGQACPKCGTWVQELNELAKAGIEIVKFIFKLIKK